MSCLVATCYACGKGHLEQSTQSLHVCSELVVFTGSLLNCNSKLEIFWQEEASVLQTRAALAGVLWDGQLCSPQVSVQLSLLPSSYLQNLHPESQKSATGKNQILKSTQGVMFYHLFCIVMYLIRLLSASICASNPESLLPLVAQWQVFFLQLEKPAQTV